MKNDKLKISRIIEELMNHFFYLGSTNMNMSIRETDESYEIYFKAFLDDLSKEEKDKLLKTLYIEKQEAMEEYYWCLTGECDCDSELSLVGMMTDEARVEFRDNGEVEIFLTRSKQ